MGQLFEAGAPRQSVVLGHTGHTGQKLGSALNCGNCSTQQQMTVTRVGTRQKAGDGSLGERSLTEGTGCTVWVVEMADYEKVKIPTLPWGAPAARQSAAGAVWEKRRTAWQEGGCAKAEASVKGLEADL